MSLDIMGGEHAYPFIIGNVKVPLFYVPSQNPNVMTITDTKEFNRTQTIGGQAFEHWGEQPATMSISMRIVKNSYGGNLIGIYNDKKYGLEDPMICTELELLKAIYHMDRRRLSSTYGDMLSSLYNKVTGSGNSSTSSNSQGIVSVPTGLSGNIVKSGGVKIIEPASAIPGTKSEPSQNFLNTVSDTIIFYKLELYSGFFKNLKIDEDGSNPFFNSVTFDFIITNRLSEQLYNFFATNKIGRGISAAVGTAQAITTIGYIVDSLSNGVSSLKGFI